MQALVGGAGIVSRSLFDKIGHQLAGELGLPGDGAGNVAGSGAAGMQPINSLYYRLIDIVVFIYVLSVAQNIAFPQLHTLDGQEHLTGFG